MKKFDNKFKTAKNEDRAFITLDKINTLWFNTGTLCNLSCPNCYIESSPKNDQLQFITPDEIMPYLSEVSADTLIALTGGEPFLNPYINQIMEVILNSGFELLILTNANRVIKKHQNALIKLNEKHQGKLSLRVSLDHHSSKIHDQERGPKAFEKTLEQIKWLYQNKFSLSIAGRSLSSETLDQAKKGYRKVLQKKGIHLNLNEKLVIFPEMNSGKDLPEITTACWEILGKNPSDQMCASERMIVKRKEDKNPVVMPCTLIAYDKDFILGNTLKSSDKKIYLNHLFCAEFCVLGGASCSLTH